MMSYLRMYRDKFVESNDLERNFYEKEAVSEKWVLGNYNVKWNLHFFFGWQ